MSPRSIAAMLCLMSLSTAHHWSSSQDDTPWQSEDSDYLEPEPGSVVEVPEVSVAHKRSKGLQLCGEKLTQGLQMICNYKYNKRSRHQADGVEVSWLELQAAVEPWRHRSQALSMLVQPRVRRGVVDECCTKSCSIRELSSYCLD